MFLAVFSLGIVYYNRNDAFVYIALQWLLVCTAVIICSKSRMRLWAVYAGTVIFTLGLFEAYCAGWFSQESFNLSIDDPSYYQTHPVLGYAPKPDAQVRAIKKDGSDVMYDVQYTVSPEGFRIGEEEETTAVAFFGGSYTFGEGVNDHETLPYQFQEKSGKHFQAYNFGFHGYGPHQMLAMLENGLEQKAVATNRPKYAIYTAIPGQIKRSAGKALWDTSGPRYRLNENGEVVYAGAFQNWFVSSIGTVLTRSHLLQLLWSKPKSTHRDIQLFAAIIEKARDIFEERYGGTLYVLLWFRELNHEQDVITELRARQIPFVRVQEALPDFNAEISNYTIRFPHELHPNRHAYELVAKFLVDYFKSHP